MSKELLFWIVMLIVLVGGGLFFRGRWRDGGPWLAFWLLLLILGWITIGSPIK